MYSVCGVLYVEADLVLLIYYLWRDSGLTGTVLTTAFECFFFDESKGYLAQEFSADTLSTVSEQGDLIVTSRPTHALTHSYTHHEHALPWWNKALLVKTGSDSSLHNLFHN